MNENRILSLEEWSEFSPVFERLGYPDHDSVTRFIDTRLNKTYDVFLLDGRIVLKKADRDKEKYDKYFAGHDFAVPPIYDSFQLGGECWVTMPYVKGSDARYCTVEDAGRVGKELAKIQSHYLSLDTHYEECKRYFDRNVLRFWNKVSSYFPTYDGVFQFVQARYFTAPRTLIHDDFLPINVLLNGKDIWLIDWTHTQILPYFLDLARFAFVADENGERFISDEAAMAFFDAYYAVMSNNPSFKIEKQDFLCDVAISAFCQYSMFVFYDDTDKVTESADYQSLQSILEYLKQILKKQV